MLLSALVLLSSCVDKAYDLSNIKTDDITIGAGGTVVPMGNLDIDLGDIVTPQDPGTTPEPGDQVTLTDMDELYDIDAGFDEGLISELSDMGDIWIELHVDNPFNVAFKISVSFENGGGSPVILITDELVAALSTTKLETGLITSETLEQISASNGLRFKLKMVTPGYFPMGSVSKFKVRFVVKKSGGIKL